MAETPKRTGFTGSHFHYGTTDLEAFKEGVKYRDYGYSSLAKHSTSWRNMRPICPYGCGQEGELVEVVMKDGRALGIYRDSEQLVFTADLQMSPKPNGRKIVIGADGEPTMVEDN